MKIVKPQIWLPVGSTRQYKKYDKVKARGLEDIDLNIDTTNILEGEIVCFTGESDYPRHTMQEIAIKNGSEITNNVTRNTTMLVVGSKAGRKLDDAQEKGIPIIIDEEFMKILKLYDKDVIA